MPIRPHPLNRRRLLLSGTAAAMAGAGLATWTRPALSQSATVKPLPAYAAWKQAGDLIQHSANTIETRRQAFGTGALTPASQLYVRNNLPPPDAGILDDRDAWRLSVEGVKRPATLTLRELKAMGEPVQLPMVLQCSGNGRGFFPSKPSGTPWTVGAAGCVIWTGVPVRSVVKALGGLESGRLYMTGTGGEALPPGIDPKTVVVERSVPLEAMADAILAWDMNGGPASLAHGGPLRLIVPGYQGVNHIKYIKRLAFTAQESDARIMSHGYRMTPPGGKADPSQPSVLQMNVKSWINGPLPESGPLAPGVVRVHGVAFSGAAEVRRVEVSADAGRTWQEARLTGPDLGRYAWRQFTADLRLPAGEHVLASRATDVRGAVQPEQREENAGGYNHNSWADHAVKVTVG